MMQEALKEAIDHNDFDFPSCEFKLWAQNGGEKTIENIRNYLCKKNLYHCDYTIVRNVFLRNLYNYLKNLPLYIELTVNHKDYVLVHAGIDLSLIHIFKQSLMQLKVKKEHAALCVL